MIPCSLFAVWVAVGCWRDEQFYQSVIAKEFLGNLAGVNKGADGVNVMGRHWASVLTYPAQLLHRLFPWSLAIVVWLIVDAKGRGRLIRDAGARWTVVWFACGLIVMSLIPGRRADRIFPVVPPLAILGAYIVHFGSWSQDGRFTRWRTVQGLMLAAGTLWGSYTLFTATRVPMEGAGLRQFCNGVITWERTSGQHTVIVGPILANDMALSVYMRQTTCTDLETVMLDDGRTNAAFIVREDHIHELNRAGQRYRIIETQTAREVKGSKHYLVTMARHGEI